MDESTPPRAEREAAPVAAGPVIGQLSLTELVALTALMMALSALSIDIMLPALPAIGAAFGLVEANSAQLVVTAYLLGIGAGQIVYGPLSDRFGRRAPLIAGLGLFLAGSVLALTAKGFALFLAARALQGFGAAGPRVIAVAIVRDLFKGRQMARVMSLVMMIFIIVPVIAPSIGQAVMLAGSWRATFGFMLAAGLVALVWSWTRLPETARPAERRAAEARGFVVALRLVVGTPETIGYTLAAGAMFGCLMSYVASAEQVFVGVFDLGRAFPLAFGSVAAIMAPAAFTNSRLVERLGMRRVAHTALAGFVVVSLVLVLVSLVGRPPLLLFCALLAAAFFQFGLIVSNFNAIAMQPMGAAAGTASSVIGFVTTTMGAVLGAIIGRQFDGTVLPLALGFALASLAAAAIIVWVEGRGGLFHGE